MTDLATATHVDTQEAPFDPDDALAKLEGDRALLIELVEIFREDSPNGLLEIRSSVTAGDALRLARAAHTLKGSVSVFAAGPATRAAAALEAAGRAGVLTDAAVHLARLEAAMDQLGPALLAFAQDEAR